MSLPAPARRRPAARVLAFLTALAAGAPAGGAPDRLAASWFSGASAASAASAEGPEVTQNDPPLGRAVVPPVPLPARSPDPLRLAEARAILAGSSAAGGVAGGSAGGVGRSVGDPYLGGYLFLSDLEEPALVERAGRLVEALEALYFERFGRRPVGVPGEAIVIFSAEADYREFQAGDSRLAGLAGSTGLAARGIVATYRGGRSDDELLGTLVHELAHLLNRRALGPSLPSWLDEGICDDLGASRITLDGRLLPGTWSRNLDPRPGEVRISGGEAALRNLAAVYGPDGSARGRLDLGAILALEWEEFVAPQGAEIHYAAAAAFIRMLLAAPARSAVFRGWLAQISEGGSPAAEALRAALDRPWEELDHDLALWTRGELARLPPLGP